MRARAIVQTADRKLELQTFDVPAALQPGEALLRVEGCGICGSDVEQYHGGTRRMGMVAYPSIPGHEIVGRLEAVDPRMQDNLGLKVGTRVAVHGIAPCGACQKCRAGLRCVHAFYYGFRETSIGSGLWGGYAEYMQLAPNTMLYPLSDSLSVEDAVLFNPLAAGFDWVGKAAGLKIGDTILILGSGQRGLACVIAAKEAGAGQIICTGLPHDRRKLQLAKQFGATTMLVDGEDKILDAVRDLTDGRGADIVVETTPMAFGPVRDAIEAVRPGGTLILAGLKGGHAMPDFPFDRVVLKALRVIGVIGTSHWAVEQAIHCVASGRYPLHLMHSHTLPITEAERAVQILAGEIKTEDPLHITLVPKV